MKFDLLQTGATGAGKTRRTLSATRFGPLLILDFDGKAEAAMRTLPEAQKALVKVENFKDKEYDESLRVLKDLRGSYSKDLIHGAPFATVAVDTFTMLNEKCYIKAMGSKLESGAKAEFAEWGKMDNMLLNFINILHSLPCNTIINAHVGMTETADGREMLGVGGRGGSRNRLAPRMTDCHYLYLRDGKYYVRARNSDSVPANSSFPETFYDAQGCLKVADLSVFDEYAYKVK